MAKDIQLIDPSGNGKLYPRTHASLVITETGKTVTEAIEGLEGSVGGLTRNAEILEETLYTNYDNLSTEISNNAGEISSLKSENTTRDLRITDHEDRITVLEGKSIELGPGSVTSEMIANNSITKDKLEDDSVRSSKIKDGEIGMTKLSVALQATIDDLGTSMDTANTDISGLKGSRDYMNGIINDLDQRLGEVERLIRELTK